MIASYLFIDMWRSDERSLTQCVVVQPNLPRRRAHVTLLDPCKMPHRLSPGVNKAKTSRE
jgi:hypothetical protein